MKRFLFFAVAAVLFAACSKDAIDEQQGIQNIVDEAPATLTVGFEDDETRIQLNEAQKTVWTNGDLVSVFYRSDANQQWQYTGETGARTADLTRVDAGEATATMNRVVVVYPYNEDYYFNTETYNVQASLPATQTYLKDSYGLDGNIMVSSSEFNQFKLKTVYGWLKLQLTGAGEKIKSISLCGNDGEQVAGDVVINTTDATITLAADGDKSDATIFTEVTLDCGEGVELGAEATAFYIALPPQTFTKGLTVEITATNGLVMTKSTDNEVVIERNHIKPMTAFGYNGVFKPANNEIYYTNGSTTEATTPYFKSVFGSTTIQSNTYDAEKECWVITFDKDVTEIGYEAFYQCNSLTSVTIPESVTTIGDWAFGYCNSLTSVTIPNSVTTIGERAFGRCIRLTSVTIGNSVTTIGEWAFGYCKSLTSVTIGDGVTTIGDYAFYSCESLTSVTIPDSVTTIGNLAFCFCDSLTSVTIGDSVTTIGEAAFKSCYSLTSVTIPDSVKTIRRMAFYECESLTSVTIGDSVTTIGDEAFYNCDSLTSVTIGDSVTTIGDEAFASCNSLTSVTIGDSVQTIGDWAFSSCDSLTSVTIPNSVKTIGDYAFNGCTKLTSMTIGDSVTTIGGGAFAGCSSLTSVTIPDSVTTIGYRAFNGCNSLKEFNGKFAADGGRCLIKDNTIIAYANASGTTYTIPDSVTTIGERAFYECTSLTSVTIGNSVTTIGDSAFSTCSSLATVYCKPTTPPTGDYGMFDYNASGRKIYVPASDNDSIINAYKAKQYWSNYKDYIFEEEPKPANNEIWYTNGSTTEPTAPCEPAAFGSATIQSNTYDAEKECWVITFDKDIEEIGMQAFYNCASLTSVNIPDSVTTIGNYAFADCNSLTSVNIPDSVTLIGHYAFCECDSLTSVTIPDSVTTIGQHAFADCKSLKEFKGKFAADGGRCLIIDNTIIAYANASGTTYTIPDSVTTIGRYAFHECYSLTSVTIPDSVTTIGEYAFSDCTSLKTVYCKPTTPPTGGYDMFYNNAPGRKILVPTSADDSIINAYKEASGWSEHKDYIFEEE